MKQRFKPNENFKTMFISSNKEHIDILYAYLIKNNFKSCYTTISNPSKNTIFSHLEPKIPFYYIMAEEHERHTAFEVGKSFAVEHDFDEIICCYPNLDCDCIKNIKEREFGITR